MKLKAMTLLSRILLLGIIFLAVPLQVVSAQGGGTAQGGVFTDYDLPPDIRVEIPLEIRNVEELYALDLELRFDPEVLIIEDANPEMKGVQPALGTFLDAGLTLYNEVDNEEGVLRFVMTQANPSEPKSGSGVVLVLYVRGVAEGETDLTVSLLELSTRQGTAIPVEPLNATVRVSSNAVAKESTAIPVQDSSALVQIPTLAPTEVLPTATATLEAGQVESGAMAEIEQASEDETQIDDDETDSVTPADQSRSGGARIGFSLVEHWWIVGIVLVLVIGVAGYLVVTRK